MSACKIRKHTRHDYIMTTLEPIAQVIGTYGHLARWVYVYVFTLRPTLDEGPRSNFLGTNLNSFEAKIESLSWTRVGTLVPSLILGSSNQELSF
jgi:hypothetical protein